MPIPAIASFPQRSARPMGLPASQRTLELRVACLIQRTIHNPAFVALASSALTAGAIAVTTLALPPFAATMVSTAALAALTLSLYAKRTQIKKHMVCELSLLSRILLGSIPYGGPRIQWHSKINEHITLGANPLKSRNLQVSLVKAGHHAVLSMIEPHETLPHLVGVPTTPEDWGKHRVSFLNIPTPDLTPVSIELIEQGVEFIQAQISSGKRVYVHCNAGVGRSATIVICYLMKYHNMLARDATEFVNSKRLIAVNENSAAIIEFAQHLTLPSTTQMTA